MQWSHARRRRQYGFGLVEATLRAEIARRKGVPPYVAFELLLRELERFLVVPVRLLELTPHRCSDGKGHCSAQVEHWGFRLRPEHRCGRSTQRMGPLEISPVQIEPP